MAERRNRAEKNRNETQEKRPHFIQIKLEEKKTSTANSSDSNSINKNKIN